MFAELNDILNIDDKNVPCGDVILIRECGTSADFALLHLLCLFLRGNHRACFLTAVQSQSHYSTVANKLGVVLKEFIDNGNLVFIEALKSIAKQITKDEVNDTDSVTEQFIGDDNHCQRSDSSCQKIDTDSHYERVWPMVDFGNDLHGSMRPLYCHLKSHFTKLHNRTLDNTKTLLLVDDISVFVHLGIPVVDVIYFCHYLKRLVCPSMNSNGCLAMLVHHDVESADEDIDLLVKDLLHSSTLYLQVSGLQSGYCRDIDGQLSVRWHSKNQSKPDRGHLGDTSMQYKVTEKNVFFFEPGDLPLCYNHIRKTM